MSSSNADRNLLFGVLALQLQFITREKLIAATAAWTRDKSRRLEDILCEQQAISADERQLLSRLVEAHLSRHNHVARESLAAASVGADLSGLSSLGDRDIDASLPPVVAGAAGGESTPARSVALEPTLEFDAASADQISTRYRILRLHALGGSGEVLVALDHELHREVAIKRIQEQFADDPHSRSRFVLEAEITGGLEHPGVVPVYGMGRQAGGRPYYAMRLIRGLSLKEAIEAFHAADKEDRNPAERALALRKLLRRFLDVCNAVHYAHSRGVLHRDLKPGNVMLGDFGETLVVDWGLAKLIGSADAGGDLAEKPLRPASAADRLPTQLGRIPGTPAYMSPEQAAGVENLTPASDVYSLGATLYTLLTGRPPLDVDNDADARQLINDYIAAHGKEPSSEQKWRLLAPVLLAKVRRGDYPEPREINPRIPAALEAICLKAMARSPGDRYASPRALADEIERWLSEEPLAAWVSAVDYFEELCAQYPAVTTYREGLARNRTSLALVQSGMGRPAEAEQVLRAAMADYEQLIERHADSLPFEVELAQVRLLLSRILISRGAREAAEQERRAAEEAMDRLLKAGASRSYYSNLASVLVTLGHSPADIQSRLAAPSGPPVSAEDTAGFALPPPESDQSSDLLLSAPPPKNEETTIGLAEDAGRTVAPKSDVQARYELLRRLASGGLASLWLARDLDLNREVVLKELNDPRKPETRRMFLREARITSLLDHPRIPTVFGVGYRAEDDAPFFTMRWLRGPTLLEAVRRLHQDADGASFDRARFEPLLAALEDVCDALAYAHRRGVIHRDPKPSNIVIDDDGHGVLIDWGLAKLVDPPVAGGSAAGLAPLKDLLGEEDVEWDSMGQVVGTPAYMAPEQALGDVARVEARSDIFALGATMYHVLTGRVPLEGDIQATLGRRIKEPAPTPRQVNPATPRELDEICRRAMAQRPEDRFADADEFAEALKQWRLFSGVE